MLEYREFINRLKKYIGEGIWNCTYLTQKQKELVFFSLKRLMSSRKGGALEPNFLNAYVRQILATQKYEENNKIGITNTPYEYKANDTKLIAYYLPQFYPTIYNDAWWGKGSTEWNNVAKSQPQYVGHYQPRLPGELGYYDLRLDENIERQVELAKMYGIYGFNFYYYWFDGKRLLDVPLDKYVSNKKINFPFALCWANESWTKQWFGRSNEVLVKQSDTMDSYKRFIVDIAKYLLDERYIKIDGKKMLTIYKPLSIPNCFDVLKYWRQYMMDTYGIELYIIASISRYGELNKIKFLEVGFDAISEFACGPQVDFMSDVTAQKKFACKLFLGKVYSYSRLVKEKGYFKKKYPHMYRAVCPMWDNTPRRMNSGLIMEGSTPDLYKEWLVDVIKENKKRTDLTEDMVFINAWNEWGEGAYLEPDAYWGYGYLAATKDALELSRNL